MSISSISKTGTALVVAMLSLGWVSRAEAHHHRPSHSAQNIHAAAHATHAVADVIRAVTGQPAVVPAPAVVAPAVVPAPAVVAPAVVTPAVAPAVVPASAVVPLSPAARRMRWEQRMMKRRIKAMERQMGL